MRRLTRNNTSTLEASMLPLACSAIGMLHAAYEESVTGVPAGASGSMRPLAAENRDRYHGYAPLRCTKSLGT